MRDQFDISGVFETTEFEIAQVACIYEKIYNLFQDIFTLFVILFKDAKIEMAFLSFCMYMYMFDIFSAFHVPLIISVFCCFLFHSITNTSSVSVSLLC